MMVMVFKSEAAKYCFSHPNLIKQGALNRHSPSRRAEFETAAGLRFQKTRVLSFNQRMGELKDWSRHILDEKVL